MNDDMVKAAEDRIERICLDMLEVIQANRHMRATIKSQDELIKMYADGTNESIKRHDEFLGELLTGFIGGLK